MPIIILILLIFVNSIAPANLIAQENIELVSTLFDRWANLYDVAVSGDYAYLATGTSGLQVVDVSDPENPEIVFKVYDTMWFSLLRIDGDHLYGFIGRQGMQIFDISNPESPELVGELDIEFSITDAAVSNDLAYLCSPRTIVGDTTLPGRLIAVDVSDAANPQVVSSYEPVDEEGDMIPIWGVEVAGNAAYIIMEDNLIRSLDFSDPENPRVLDEYDDRDGSYHGMALQNEHLYISKNDGLLVLDAIFPNNIRDPNLARGLIPMVHNLVANGDQLFAFRDRGDVLYIIDISDAEDPELVGRLEMEGGFMGAAGTGDLLCTTTRTDGFDIVDISNPEEPEPISEINNYGLIGSVKVNGECAYVLDEYSGIHVVGLNQDNMPVELSFIEIGEHFVDFDVFGELLCYATRIGIYFFDISDPENPEEILQFQPDYEIGSVDLIGDILYSVTSDWRSSKLVIFDISDLEDITEIANLFVGHYDRVCVNDDYAYVIATLWGRMIVVDLWDIENPSIVNEHNPDVRLLDDIDFYFDYAVLATGRQYGDGLWTPGLVQIIDVANPENIQFLAEYEPDFGGANAITMFDDYALIVDYEEGLHIIDLTDPDDPTETGFYNCPDLSEDVDLLGNFAFVANYGHLGVYDCTDALGLSSVEQDKKPIANQVALTGLTPNPFNTATTISFSLTRQMDITLKVYDQSGRMIRTIFRDNLIAGSHNVAFEAGDLPAGVYIVRLRSSGKTMSMKVVLLK